MHSKPAFSKYVNVCILERILHFRKYKQGSLFFSARWKKDRSCDTDLSASSFFVLNITFTYLFYAYAHAGFQGIAYGSHSLLSPCGSQGLNPGHQASDDIPVPSPEVRPRFWVLALITNGSAKGSSNLKLKTMPFSCCCYFVLLLFFF